MVTKAAKKNGERAPRAKRAAHTRRVYLDYAAATPLSKEALSALVAFERRHGANPSSTHADGVAARREIDEARHVFAREFSAHPDEVVFTGNATEANMIALKSAVEMFRVASPDVVPEILISSIEHASVVAAAEKLMCAGRATVREIPVDEHGIVSLKTLREMITPSTAIISVMYANNEFGTIEPIRDVVKAAARARKVHQSRFPLVHTDACQAAQFLEIASSRLAADFLTMSPAKLYGPKGTGVLFARRGVTVTPTIPGEQEQGRRGGTEWGAGIIAAAAAFTQARKGSAKEGKRLEKLSAGCIAELTKHIPEAVVNGHPTERVPHIVHFSIPGIAHDYLALALDAEGFAVSTGSACTSALGAESRAILALRKPGISGGIRISIGRDTTARDLKQCVRALSKILARMRPYAGLSDL